MAENSPVIIHHGWRKFWEWPFWNSWECPCNHPPWLEKILRFACLKWLRMALKLWHFMTFEQILANFMAFFMTFHPFPKFYDNFMILWRLGGMILHDNFVGWEVSEWFLVVKLLMKFINLCETFSKQKIIHSHPSKYKVRNTKFWKINISW